MTALFGSIMRNAAGILFTIGIIVMLMSLWTTFGMAEVMNVSPYAPDSGVPLWRIFASVRAALQSAVWPLTGSALVWRWDQHFNASGPEE